MPPSLCSGNISLHGEKVRKAHSFIIFSHVTNICLIYFLSDIQQLGLSLLQSNTEIISVVLIHISADASG